MKILVTGGCGFIGSNTVDRLIYEGYDVIVVDNLSTGNEKNLNKCARFYQEDIKSNNLKNIFAKELPEVVYHFAAQINVQLSLKDPIYDLQNNIQGTINVLECMSYHNVKKIVYPSSAAVYGDPKYLPIDEDHIKNPLSFYGISKFTPEYYIKVFSDIYNFKYSILRYANVYGIRQNPKSEGGVVSIFIDMFNENKSPVIFGDGNQTRDFIYVKDVVDSNLAVLNSNENEIFNISNETSISINDLFYEIKNIFKSNINQKYLKVRRGDIKHSVLKNKKIRDTIGWSPKYSLKQGLKETIDYYQNIKKGL